MTDKTTLKQWFTRGKKPTAAQFAEWMDSYWHLSDEITISSVKELAVALAAKADTTAMQTAISAAVAELSATKQDKSDASLQTAAQTIVGAINEVAAQATANKFSIYVCTNTSESYEQIPLSYDVVVFDIPADETATAIALTLDTTTLQSNIVNIVVRNNSSNTITISLPQTVEGYTVYDAITDYDLVSAGVAEFNAMVLSDISIIRYVGGTL